MAVAQRVAAEQDDHSTRAATAASASASACGALEEEDPTFAATPTEAAEGSTSVVVGKAGPSHEVQQVQVQLVQVQPVQSLQPWA